MSLINKFLRKRGYAIIKLKVGMTRGSVKYAKDYFSNGEIDVVEIGVFEGTNANSMLKELNINNIILIDPYLYEPNSYSYKDIVNAERKAGKLLRSYKNIKWIKDKSENVYNEVGHPDFIYVDGSHKYEDVKKDISLYYNVLKVGGIIAGDDLTLPGVSKAFWEFVYTNKIKLENVFYSDTDTDWWIIKDGK